MKISPKTKISALIKVNPAAIEAIASINSHFNKLRNPVLRKILASRVTIADAARMGGTNEAIFFEKLLPLGFEAEGDSLIAEVPDTVRPATAPPADLPVNVVPLDVREALETGDDPFIEIMDNLEALEPDQALLLINTFEPTPLISIVKKRGFTHYSEVQSPELVHTYFYKTLPDAAEKVPVMREEVLNPDLEAFEKALADYQDHLQEVDVRNLEMPLPMVTILEILPRLKKYEALLVHHRRVPQYLLPQLADRGFRYAVNELGPEEIQLLIFKNK